jgi:hypothetical protein
MAVHTFTYRRDAGVGKAEQKADSSLRFGMTNLKRDGKPKSGSIAMG